MIEMPVGARDTVAAGMEVDQNAAGLATFQGAVAGALGIKSFSSEANVTELVVKVKADTVMPMPPVVLLTVAAAVKAIEAVSAFEPEPTVADPAI